MRNGVATVQRGAPPIAASVLLAGGLRPSPLVRASGRSALDLYLTPTKTALALWVDRLGGLAAAGGGRAPIRVLHDANNPAPTLAATGEIPGLSIEREPGQYRGPAGVLRDVCADYDPDLPVLVCDASRFLDGELDEMLQEHALRKADITVACDAESAPVGVYLVRCAALALAPRNGFMDLKEQLLDKALSAGKGIWVHRLGQRRSFPLRTRAQFLRAARAANGRSVDDAREIDVFSDAVARGGEPPWSVVASDAEVGANAVVVDSVVMPGAVIGAGSVVARCVVCPGSRIEPGASVVDAVITGAGVKSDEDAGFAPARTKDPR